MASDGYIYRNRVCLTMADRDVVEILKSLITTNKIQKITRLPYKDQYSLVTESPVMIQDLGRYGIVNKKSLILKFPDIHEKLERHFIRGVFDGDGGIHLGSCREIHFIGTYDMMFSIRKSIENHIPGFIPHPYLRDKSRPDKNTWRLKIRNRDQMIHMRSYMYSGSNYYMKRKYDMMNDIENHFSREQKHYRKLIM